MPRAKKPSPFGNFVQEQLKESGGRTNMRDACKDPEIVAKWKNMSVDEKAKYKAIKTAKPNQKKMTNLGEDLTVLKGQEMREKQFADDMREYINNKVIAASQKHRLKYMTFYVIHCNYYYKKTFTGGQSTDFFPAEICIIECNLEQGIKNTYVQHFRPDIDQGFRAEAIEHSNKTHHIPLGAQFEDKKFKDIYEEICTFIMPGTEGDKLPPLFTRYRRDESLARESVISIMDQLAEAAGKPTDLIRIYSLEDLIASMCNASLEIAGRPYEVAHAMNDLNKDPYQWKTGIQCHYHTTTLKCGMAYCSQSFVTRWFYVICHKCCEALKVKMKEGVHSPPESEVLFRESSLYASSIYDSKGTTRSKSDTSSKNENSQDADFVIVIHRRNHQNSSTEPSVKSPQQIFNDADFPSLGNVPSGRNEISSAGNALENLTINDSKGATRSKSNTSSKKGNSRDADVIIVTHSSNHRNSSTKQPVKSPQQNFNPYTINSQSFQNNEENFPQLAKPPQHNSSIPKNNVKKAERRPRK